MVLFNETEAVLLLDLYLHYRSNPQNLTSGGVLLKMHARDELTRAMNRYFKREAPWTESQVTVKFKNLRSEYIELKWLAEQPGFQLDGKGITEEWWADIKTRRPKVHAFKGKLPWPFFKKMGVIVGDLHPTTTTNVTDTRSMQRISQLLSDMAADAANNASASANSGGMMVMNGTNAHSSGVDFSGRHASVPGGVLLVPQPAKRPRDSNGNNSSHHGKRPRKRVADLSEDEQDRQQSLAKSVEHGSKAAADMAKGFNDLVGVFQQQVARCAQLTSADGSGDYNTVEDAQEERQILVSLASSLERSAQATAEMAKGYRDLVSFLIQETDETTTIL